MNREDSSKHRYGYVIRTLSVVHCIGLVHLAPPAPTSSNVQQVCCNLIGCCEELWLVLIGSGLRAWGHGDYRRRLLFFAARIERLFRLTIHSVKMIIKKARRKGGKERKRKFMYYLCIFSIMKNNNNSSWKLK